MQTSVWASPPSGSSLVSSAVDIQSETVPPEFGFIKDISSSYSRGLVAIREALIQAVQVIALDSCRVNNPRLRITYISNKKTVIRADCQGASAVCGEGLTTGLRLRYRYFFLAAGAATARFMHLRPD
jgi:hypothetical protein